MGSLLTRLSRLALWLIVLSASAVSTFGQTPSSPPQDDDEPDCGAAQFAYLTIQSDPHGTADLSLSFCADSAHDAELAAKVSTALSCPQAQIHLSVYGENEIAAHMARCKIQLARRAFEYASEIDPAPILDLVRITGSDTLSVYVWIPSNGAARCDPPANEKYLSSNLKECTYLFDEDENKPRVIHYSFGYDRFVITRIVLILGSLLLIPIITTFWFRRQARSAPEESKISLVFSYRRFIVWTALGGALVWWTAADALHVDDFVQFLISLSFSTDSGFGSTLPWILIWIPPAVVYFLCLALSSPIQTLRGTTRTQGQIFNQSFWSVARFIIPLSLLFLGFSELPSSPRLAVLLFAGWIVTSRFINQKFADASGMNLHALTSGDLRDRAFAIAQKAGAKLNQLYVLPTESTRMANAFAHAANNIFLTDYLLKNLSRREVDAVVGHEVAHLQKKHIRTRVLIWVMAMLVFGFATAWSGDWLPSGFPSGPVVYGSILFLIFFVSRRNEFAADAGAVKLTGDAEAMITALAKISRLNTMPLHWGKVDEKLLTHPSTLRRIKHLAQVGGISEARIPDLLSQSTATPTDVYPIPATVRPSGKIFSTRYKAWVTWSIAWILLITCAAVPAFVVSAIRRTHFSGLALSLSYLSGIFLTIACCLVLCNFLPFMGMPKLEFRLREKLEREGGPLEIRSGLFVGLAPDSSPRVYEGNWAWDVGFLRTADDRLFYYGEEARFDLPREQVTSVSLGPGPVGWFRTRAVYVTWRDVEGNVHTINLRPLQARSMVEMARQTRRLATDLENWHRGIQLRSASIPSIKRAEIRTVEASSVPGFSKVTSMSPRALATGKSLTRLFLFETLVGIGIAILFGFQFPFADSIAPSLRPEDVSSTGGAMLYIIGAMWLARVALLWPLWGHREAKTQPAPVPPVPSPAAQP